MSGPLGTGSGNPGKDVLAGTGISVSGTTAFTVSNTGVTSLAGSGVSVSAATGAVTVTAPTVTGGTGISVSGSGTTSLTVSATGVQSLTAGTGISVSGTTTPTVTNSGVTSIVAGTNVTVSGATGAVTINASGGGGGTSPVLIASTTLSANTASITFSSIPSTYKSLQLIGNYHSTTGSVYEDLLMRVNGAAGSTYSDQRGTTLRTEIRIAQVVGWAGGYGYTPAVTYLTGYTNTGTGTSVISTYGYWMSSANYTSASALALGSYESTTTVSSILLFCQSGSFQTNTSVQLYGWP